MKLLTRTPIAIIIMVVVILSSGLLGCRRSLISLKKTADDYFYAGENGDGNSIQSNLDYIGATANNLKTIAVRYIDPDDKLIADLTESRSKLASAKAIPEKHAAAQSLFDTVTALYNSLNPDIMNSTDKNFRSSLYDDIRSAMQQISYNGYNDAAREFNETLEHFPANFISGLVGIRSIPLYG